MNHYEAKQEARRERYERLSEKARADSDSAYNRAGQIGAMIPFGQPILVGHHSEKHHRADLKRIDNAMRRSINERDKANHYAGKADSVGKGGISSDDPEALVKLREKLAKMEARRAGLKALNLAHKRFLKNPESLDKSDLDFSARFRVRNYTPRYSWEPHPVPPYEFTNLSGNMRRIKQRIAELDREAKTEASPDVQGDGFTVSQAPHDNRIRVYFDTKPPKEICQLMRSRGFVFSRAEKGWQRKLNNAGRYAAQAVAAELNGRKETAA